MQPGIDRPAYAALGLALFMAACGCAKRQAQVEVEGAVASRIISLLKEHESKRPGRFPTNMAELFENLGKPYHQRWDAEFRAFGKQAGFTNSIYEKYTFLVSVTNAPAIPGVWVLIHAKPFPDKSGQPMRFLISRIGTEQDWYQINRLTEDRVETVFREAGVPLPKLASFPRPLAGQPKIDDERPSYSLVTRTQMLLDQVAENVGLGRGHWPTVLFALVLLGILLGTFLFVWVGRRRR